MSGMSGMFAFFLKTKHVVGLMSHSLGQAKLRSQVTSGPGFESRSPGLKIPSPSPTVLVTARVDLVNNWEDLAFRMINWACAQPSKACLPLAQKCKLRTVAAGRHDLILCSFLWRNLWTKASNCSRLLCR